MVTVGIDPHKHTHTAVIIDEMTGRRLAAALTLTDDDPQIVAKLAAWITKHAPDQAVRIVIEDGRSVARRFADALVAAGYPVAWVPVRLVVAERAHTGPRGKSDPLDALAVAKAASNPDNTVYLSTHSLNEIGAEFAPLVDARRELVAERTRLINNMRWRLHRYAPHLAPTDLTTAHAGARLANHLTGLPDQPNKPNPMRQVLLDDCEHLTHLTTRINALTRHLDHATHHRAPTLRARPGVGAITAATLLAELGDPTRIRHGAALARMAGTAPIPANSGNPHRYRLDPGGNRRLNHAIHIIAIHQARNHPPAQALITKHTPHKGKRGALRILKRHLTDAIYRDLLTDLQPAA